MNRFAAFLVLFATIIFAPRLTAELVWTPESGWVAEEGAVSAFAGVDAREALDLMNEARVAEERGDTRRAIKLYERSAERFPNAIYAPEALYRVGKLRLTRKQYYKAFEAYQAVVGRYPSTERFNEIIGEQYRIAAALMDGARNYIFGIIPGFRNRDRAVQYFEQILMNAPYSDYAPLALMNIARAHQKLGNDFEAIDALDRMINNYSQSLLAPDAYLALAETHASLVDGPYYDQASTREAITYFEDFMILFPDDEGVVKAEEGLADMREVLAKSKMKIADYYYKYRSNYQAARVFYNEAITVYPDSEVADRAREQLVRVEEAEREAEGTTPRRKFLGIF